MDTESILGTAVVMIRGDMSKLPEDLSHAGASISKQFSLANTIGGIAEIGKTAIAAYAPIKFIEKGLELVSEQWSENLQEGRREAEQMIEASRKLKVSLDTLNTTGIGADTMLEEAEKIHKATGTSMSGIVDFQSELTRFQNVQDEVFKRATRVAVDYANLTGRSLPAAAHIFGRSLNDPIMGLSMLRRAGVALTDTQQKMIKRLAESGQVFEAQDALLKALEARYGGASNRLSTETKRLKSDLSDIREDIGRLYKEREPFTLRMKIILAEIQKGAATVVKDVTAGKPQLVDQLYKNGKYEGDTAMGGAKIIAGSFWGALKQFITPEGWKNIGSGGARGEALEENNRLDRQQKEIDKRRADKEAEKSKPALDLKSKRLAGEGFFDPIALAKKFQESMLGNDAIVGAVDEVNKTLQNGVRVTNMGDAGPVAGPTG